MSNGNLNREGAGPHRQDTLITLLAEAAQQLVAELVERLNTAGYSDIRTAHNRVFAYIDSKGTRLTELAERAQMTHPSMSELVDGLVRSGYLQRTLDPGDGRVRLVRLTPAGRALQRRALAEIADIEATLLKGLGPTLVKDLRAALGALTRPVHAPRGGRRQATVTSRMPSGPFKA
jgi:DNA-binding MarR family transcriptional regulator